jgi:hypothetical protein
VGSFGDGHINAFDAASGSYLGALSDSSWNPLVIKGLWGLDPVPTGEITFSAGPNKESHGELGLISAVQ